MSENERIEASIEYKHSGCNCCQAILMAYADLLGLEKDKLMSLGAGFGMGMGCMEGTCGALCGAVIVAGILTNGNKTTFVSKQIHQSFKEKSGATICKDLKGVETGKILCSCDDCVKNAAKTLAEVFTTEKVL